MRGVLLCVHDFVRSPHFTQRNSFSETGLTMLSESVAIADSLSSSPAYAPWIVVESACARQVVSELCACWDWVVLRRRFAKDTSERWSHGGTILIETASRPGVRISDVVEEGRVEYVSVAPPALGPTGPSKIRSPSSKRNRTITRSPMKLPRRFEVSSPPASHSRRSLVEDPILRLLWLHQLLAGSLVGVGVIVVPLLYFKWAFHKHSVCMICDCLL